MASTSADATRVSSWWRHSVILVMIAGFSVLALVTVLTYTNAPPIPLQAVDRTGTVVFTGADIQKGQEVFLKFGLMEHGTLWGHGAYLGPDYSAEYLHRLCGITRDTIATEKYGKLFAQVSPDQQSAAAAQTIADLKENRYDPASRTLRLTTGEVAAYQAEFPEWSDYFTRKDAAPGLPANYIDDPAELKDLTAYFAWAAWATTARRPGTDYSYTNNWPYEPLAGNRPPPPPILERHEPDHPAGRAGSDPVRLRQVRLPGLEGEGADRLFYALCSRCLDAHAQPEGPGMVLRGGSPALPGADGSGRRDRPLPGGARCFLWLRHGPACCPTTWRAPGTCSSPSSGSPPPGLAAACSWRPWSAAQNPRVSRPASSAPGRAGVRRLRQPRRRIPGHQRQAGPASGSGSDTRVRSTSTSAGSGRCCWPWAWSSGYF